MKRIILSTCCFMAFGAFSQSYTFTKNQEIARYQELKNLTTAYFSLFTTSESITPDILSEISTIMETKDGYVILEKIDDHTIGILHESFIESNDIHDVIKINDWKWIFISKELTTFL